MRRVKSITNASNRCLRETSAAAELPDVDLQLVEGQPEFKEFHSWSEGAADVCPVVSWQQVAGEV